MLKQFDPIFCQNLNVELSTLLLEGDFSSIHVLMDENTHLNCWPLIHKETWPKSPKQIVIPAGEGSKNLETCKRIWATLLNDGVDRKGLIISLGGGMISDLAGFVAATYKRGIETIYIPTTYLAMVDASIGGKCGVNFGNAKNQIGLFSLPYRILIDTVFLNTLEKKETLSGYAETIKHSLIVDHDFFYSLKEKLNTEVVVSKEIIQKSSSIKLDIVKKDPSENDLRKKLNFGHSIGHAIESFFMNNSKGLPHGFAIAVGMLLEADISNQKGMLTQIEFLELKEYILNTFPYLKIPSDQFNALLELVHLDKKKQEKKLNFTLLSGIGSSEINCDVSDDQILIALENYLNYGEIN